MYYEKFMSRMITSSGWSTDEEFSTSQGCLNGGWDAHPAQGGVILYNHDRKLVVDGGDECRHVLIIGATGTGKSRLIIMPSLIYSLRAIEKRSMVIFDVKGELRQATLHTAQENGYQIVNVDFRQPSQGDTWNPFARANCLFQTGRKQNKEKAWKLVEDIIASVFNDGPCTKSDPFWRNSSSDLFRGICTVLWESGKEVTLQSVLKLSDSIPGDKDDDGQCELFRLAARLPASSAANRRLAGFQRGSDTTRGNVLASFRGYLSPLTARSDVLDMVSGKNSIDLQQVGTSPTVLYISLPDDTTALGALQGILLQQLMQELNECAIVHSGRLPVRTEIYLDELCNIKPAIPSLETALTIARSRGIRYVLAVQSYAQLTQTYGAAAETISANASTWIALNIAKDETFRSKLSQLCGYNPLGDPLITPSQLARLGYEEAIVIRERCAPYFTLLDDVVDRLTAPPTRKCGRKQGTGCRTKKLSVPKP